ncbi:MAG: hypothetical protein U0798_03040 [Gemmataceae bacterium]
MALRGAISLSALLGLGAMAVAQQPARVSDSVEKKIYYSKPAEGVVPAQAIAPPAPPPIFQPLTMPALQSQPVPPFSNSPAVGQLPDLSVVQPNINAAKLNQPAESLDKLVPPKREDVFRFDSDKVLEERIRREAPITAEKRPQDVYFPPVSKPEYAKTLARSMPSMQVTIEPAYVTHRRLFFEQKNTERAGWDYGTAQPIISAFHFYADCDSAVPHGVEFHGTVRHECRQVSARQPDAVAVVSSGYHALWCDGRSGLDLWHGRYAALSEFRYINEKAGTVRFPLFR